MMLAPSILSADFSCLGEQVKLVTEAGADYIHIDVMDGHFVPNISFGSKVMKGLNKVETAPYDVHLMIENPDKYLEEFITDKTGYITVHQEACPHLDRTIQHIRDCGVKAGVAINPATPVSMLECILDKVDMVLIMSVNPGFGGQKLIPSTLDKVRQLVSIREEKGYDWIIQIDGGVNLSTLDQVIDSGVDMMVAGSAVFGAEDIRGAVASLKK